MYKSEAECGSVFYAGTHLSPVSSDGHSCHSGTRDLGHDSNSHTSETAASVVVCSSSAMMLRMRCCSAHRAASDTQANALQLSRAQ